MKDKIEKEKMTLNSIVAILTSLLTCGAIFCGVAFSYGQQKEFIKHADEKTKECQIECKDGDSKLSIRVMSVEANDQKQDIQLAVFIETMKSILKELEQIKEEIKDKRA